MSIWKKHFLYTAVPITFLGFISLYLTLFLADRSYLDKTKVLSQQNIERTGYTLSSIFEEKMSMARTLASSPTLQEGTQKEIFEYLAREEERLGDWTIGLYLCQLDGIAYGSRGNRVDFRSRDYFPKYLRGEEVMTGILASLDHGKPIFLFIAPLFDAKGNRKGGLAMTFTLEGIFSRLDRVDDSVFFLVDQNSRLITRAPLPIDQAPVEELIAQGKTYDIFHTLNGDYRFVLSEDLGLPVRVGMIQTQTRQIAGWNLFTLIGLAGVALATLLSLLLAWFLGRRLLNPLHRLTSGLREFGQNKSAPQIEHNRKDEIGRLISAFNQMTGTIRDQDELQKSLERKLLHEEKMSAIGNLASGIAHEFNNCLTIIKGHLELLSDEVGSDPMTGRRLERIQKAATRAQTVVNQIRAFIKTEKNSHRTIAVDQLIFETLSLIEPSLPPHLLIETDFPEKPLFVSGDETQLGQVIINLIRNACQAVETQPEGRVIIRVRESGSISQNVAIHRFVEIQMIDNGPGVAEVHCGRVFEPFFSTKQRSVGTGLGLPVAKGIIEAHGGQIQFDNLVDGGAKLTVHLPMVESVDALNLSKEDDLGPDTVEDENRISLHGLRIVLIDDEKDIIDVLVSLLEQTGCRVYPYQNPLKAFEDLVSERLRADILITDQHMPEISGLTLVRRLDESRIYLPAVLITGDDISLTDQQFRDAHVDQVVNKPIESTKLISILAKLRGRLTPPAELKRLDRLNQ